MAESNKYLTNHWLTDKTDEHTSVIILTSATLS